MVAAIQNRSYKLTPVSMKRIEQFKVFRNSLSGIFMLVLVAFEGLMAQTLTEQTGASNPMDGVTLAQEDGNTAFADLDADGDWDLLIGWEDGTFIYFQNTGTSASPVLTQQFGANNPMNGEDVGTEARPILWDIDNDGDFDLFVGENFGRILYFQNTGSPTTPIFTQRTSVYNPFNGVDVGAEADLAFADIDNDGDADAFIGEVNGNINYFQNTGNASNPAFTQQTGVNNPMNGEDIGAESAPTLMDFDGDGDYDMFVGASNGFIYYFRNTGTVGVPAFTEVTGAGNPFNGIDFGEESRPMAVDLNADGDTDVLVLEKFGTFRFFTGSGTGSAPLDDSPLSPGDMTYTSSTVTQNSNDVVIGRTEQQIVGIQVVTFGNSNKLDLSSINFNTTGSSDPATDFSNAKLYYTGGSSVFAATNQVGPTIAGPNGTFTINGTQTLAAGTNYFWLSYDISGGATAGNLVDAQATQITVDASNYVPSTTAPSGARTIITQPYAEFPYFTGFETGNFENVWARSSSNSFGRVLVTNNNTPRTGSYHMTMDVNTDGNFAANYADLFIDLAGQTNVVLDFYFKDFGDEDQNVDGIYLSDDGGTNFIYVHEIAPGDYTNATWNHIILNIDELASTYGLTLNSTFVIRIHQYDNYGINNDGFAIDDLEVKAGPVYADFPYSTSFEQGYFEREWAASTSNSFGRLQVTSANGPRTGNYHMTMDVTTANISASNYADLYIDLAGQTDVILDFYLKDFGDEDQNVDGIYLSDDGGTNFTYVYEIEAGNITNDVWTQIVLDIDDLALANGLTLNSTFVVRILQFDNQPIGADGFGIDDLKLRTTTFASIPYYNGFESGGFAEEWSIGTANNSNTIVTDQNTPYEGTYHMTMDRITNGGFTLNEAMLRIDLSGQTQVEMAFYWKDFGDETHPQDAIYFSDDNGATFHSVYSFNPGSNANNTWNQIVLDVDALASGAGLSLTNQFVISFEQYDNRRIASNDGMAFDNIAVYVPNTLTNWTGNTGTTTWGTAGNWSNGVPGCSSLAIIPDVSGGSGFFPVIGTGLTGTVGSIQIQANASITINSGGTLNICSNWENRGNASIGTGTVVFQGTGPQQITGTSNWQNITVNNTGGDITLNDAQNINGVLTLTDGIINTQYNAFTMNSGSSATGASAASFVYGRITKVGNTDFQFPIGDGTDWAPLAIANLTGNAATEFTADYARQPYIDTEQLLTGDPNGDLNHVSALEYWNLTNSGTSSDADVTLFWKDQTFSGITDYGDLQIAHYNGSVWENMGQNVLVSSDPGSITVTGVSSFSPFTFASASGGNPLPVDLISFNAREENGKVLLDWQTASELNNDFFEVQRSEDGENWMVIGEVEGNGTINEVIEYDYTDTRPLFGSSYYRLRQVDFDGQFEYSPVQGVNIQHSGRSLEVTLYPNPTTGDNINIRLISANRRNNVKLRLIDLSGKMFLNKFVDVEKFAQDQRITPCKELQKGIYILEVDQNNVVSRHKIIIFK